MDARTSRYHEIYARWQRDPEGFWGEAAREIDWIEPAKKVFDPKSRRLRALVRRRRLQHLLERGRPPCECRARAAARDHLRLAACRNEADDHLRPAADRDAGAGRHAARPRRRQGRPRHPLHADDSRGGDRHARLRAHRRDPLGGVRRLCRQRACDPDRRLQAEGHPVGELRARARPHRQVQAAARRGDRAVVAQARRLPDPAAAAGARPRWSPGAITTGRRCATTR